MNRIASFAVKKAVETMPRNVEIKAKVHDYEQLVRVAKKLSENEGITIKQEDTFFNGPNGRLKLRVLKETDSQLIYYERPDGESPKLSSFCITRIPYPEELLKTLGKAIGIKGTVKKSRVLYMVGQTRVHIDTVEGLAGHYMELEVQLTPEQTVEDGEIIAQDLMRKFNIQESDLVKGAYIDLLSQK